MNPLVRQIGIPLHDGAARGKILAARPPDLIPGLLRSTGYTLLVGETDVGKTLVAIEIAQAVLNGTALWGALSANRIQRAVYILGEHTSAQLVEQCDLAGLQVASGSEFWLVGPEVFPDRHVAASGHPRPHVIQRLQDLCKGAQLVIFDPLIGFARGADVENDNVQMRTLISTLGETATRAGGIALILHHMGKPQLFEGQERKRDRYASRGASAIEDTGAHVWYLSKVGQGTFELANRKFKGKHAQVYRLDRDPGSLTHTLANDTKTKAQLFRNALLDLQGRKPDMTYTEAVETVARNFGASERQAWRWAQGE